MNEGRTGAARAVGAARAGPVEVRLTGPDEWMALREVRLAALHEAPDAFCSTHEHALAQTERYWRAWPKPGIVLLAWRDADPVGMVRVGPFGDDPATAGIYSMWVRPSHRGNGTVDALISAALAWAAEHGRTRAVLEVAPGNDRAVGAYERNGFAHIDQPCSMPGGHVMARPLTPGARPAA